MWSPATGDSGGICGGFEGDSGGIRGAPGGFTALGWVNNTSFGWIRLSPLPPCIILKARRGCKRALRRRGRGVLEFYPCGFLVVLASQALEAIHCYMLQIHLKING